jgi:uncharacterized coiled-coil protein SlyX
MTFPKSSGNMLPIPDPTPLTTDMVLREVHALREVLDMRIAGNDRLIAMLQDSLAERAVVIRTQVDHLQQLQDEKFRSIQTQFVERDTRAEQTAKDSKVAVDAALQAAKEAVGEQNKSSSLAISKSESGTTKQIDQISINIATSNSNLNDKIDDVKGQQVILNGQLLLMSGKIAGGNDNKDDNRSNIGIIVAVLAVVVAAAAMIIDFKGASGPVGTPSLSASPPIIYVQPTPQTQAPVVIQPNK